MLIKILVLLINLASDIYTIIILLRLLMQLARVDFYNPISQFVVKATDPLLRPLRRLVPGFGGVDVPSIVLAFLVQLFAMLALMLIMGVLPVSPLFYLLLPLLGVASVLLTLLFFAIIIVIVISWVAPNNYNPAAILLRQIAEPVLAPFRRLVPAIGGLDFSPMLLMFVLYVLQSIVLPELIVSVGGAMFLQVGYF